MLQKAVIPIGWTGRSFLGSAEGLPAELLPVLDLPAIHHVVEEAVASGAEEVILLGGRSLHTAREYFDEEHSAGSGIGPWAEDDRFSRLQRLRARCDLRFVDHHQPESVGRSLLQARAALAEAPFAWLRPDVLIDSERPCLAQLTPHYHEATLVAVHPADSPDADTLPLVQTHAADIRRVTDLVSEETDGGHGGRLALTGRHILHPDILQALCEVPAGPGDLLSALRLMAQTHPTYCHRFIGTPFSLRKARGLMRANLAMAGRTGLTTAPTSPWVFL